MADQVIHGNVLVHKNTKRVYQIIHPKVQGPDRIIRIGVIDTTTGMLMYIHQSALNDFDEYTKSEWQHRKYNPSTMTAGPSITSPNRHVHYVPYLGNGKPSSSTQLAPTKQKLIDVLKIDDIIASIQDPSKKDRVAYDVIYIDDLTGFVTVKSKSDGSIISIHPSYINEYYTRVGQKEAAKPHILNIVRILETHVYEHLYYETWLDRYYQRYCIKRGRDIPREERIEDEEHVFVASGEIYRYLKDNIPLNDLKALKKEINEDHDLKDVSKDIL